MDSYWANDYFENIHPEHPFDSLLTRPVDTLMKYSEYPIFDFSFLPPEYAGYMYEAIKLEEFNKPVPKLIDIQEFMTKFYLKIYDHFNFDKRICDFLVINFQNMIKFGWDQWIYRFKVHNYYIN